MSTSKHFDKFCIAAVAFMLIITVLFMFGEKLGITVIHREEDENTSAMFTGNDLNADWDAAGATSITLEGDSAKISGNGAYFSSNTLHIVYAGKYILSGALNGSIHIDADGDDKIWLLFDDVEITSDTDPPLYISQADKVFLTLKENSLNTLTFGNNDADSEADGCIFSRDDLTINGKGTLTVRSEALHGIVCNDSLVFAGGNIDITAGVDAVHAHDAIKICNTALTVAAGDDGLHAGNDDESSVFYMESGSIDIAGCYEGIEANDVTITGGTVNIRSTDDGINACGGSAAQITVSGGDITIINENGRDADGFDSNGNIDITGGNVFISVSGNGTNSAIDYGSETGGSFTISGGTIIACGSSMMAESPDSASAQGFIMQNVSGNANDTLSLLDLNRKEIISREIPCSFTSALISAPDMAVGDTVILKTKDTETEITITNISENGMGGFRGGPGFGQGVPDGNNRQNPPGMPGGSERGTPPEMPDGTDRNAPPEMPDGTEGNVPPEMPDGTDRNAPPENAEWQHK